MDTTRTLGAALVTLLAACSSDESGSSAVHAAGSAGTGAGAGGDETAGAGAAGTPHGPSPTGSGGAPNGDSVGVSSPVGAGGASRAPAYGGNAGRAGPSNGGAGGKNMGAMSAGGAGGMGAGGMGAAGMGAAGMGAAGMGAGGSARNIDHVFVVAMENHDEVQIIGDTKDAPYINGTLVKDYASAAEFTDLLSLNVPSEPHYILMEAGTNAFSDRTFTNDDDPSASNSTASTDHLAAQMKNASPPVSFMAYQEGLDSSTGACPIHSSGFYASKHDPFVFFQDVSGSPPSASNSYCAAHHKPLTSLSADLRNDAVADYVFVTPNLCNDMHGASGCPNSNTIRAGDDWLKTNLPAMIDYSSTHRGVIFIVFDEGSATLTMPFLAIGPGVKKGYIGRVTYNHRSLVKSVERIFGMPILTKVAGDSDFADLFASGRFP